MPKQSDGVRRCPRCFGRDVRPSQRRGMFDNIMEMLRRAPYRCRNCHKRFYVFVRREDAETESKVEQARKTDAR